MNRFSDFADATSPILDGKKISMEEVLEREIIVLNFRVKDTKFTDAKNPQCLTVQFSFVDRPDDRRVVFSGSSVLIRQLEQYKAKLPFTSVIQEGWKILYIFIGGII